jgi:hypothetical protein
MGVYRQNDLRGKALRGAQRYGMGRSTKEVDLAARLGEDGHSILQSEDGSPSQIKEPKAANELVGPSAGCMNRKYSLDKSTFLTSLVWSRRLTDGKSKLSWPMTHVGGVCYSGDHLSRKGAALLPRSELDTTSPTHPYNLQWIPETTSVSAILMQVLGQ